MKLLLPVVAILGLCSAAGAASLSIQDWSSDAAARHDTVIGGDGDLNIDAAEQSFATEPGTPLVTTSIDSGVMLANKGQVPYEALFTPTSAPEPPPVTTITLGLAFLAAAVIIRRLRTERRRARRRARVRVRSIIAAR